MFSSYRTRICTAVSHMICGPRVDAATAAHYRRIMKWGVNAAPAPGSTGSVIMLDIHNFTAPQSEADAAIRKVARELCGHNFVDAIDYRPHTDPRPDILRLISRAATHRAPLLLSEAVIDHAGVLDCIERALVDTPVVIALTPCLTTPYNKWLLACSGPK
jgi:hypothetical protein